MQIATVSEADIPNATITQIKHAYRQLGFTAQLQYMPALRALKQAEHAQEFDAVLLREPTAESYLTQYLKIDVPLRRLLHVAYATRTQMGVSDWQSLNHYRIAIVRGFLSINQALADHQKLEIVNSVHQAIRMLETGRVDLAILPDIFGNYEIEHHGHSSVKPVAVLGQTYLYHFIHKKHRELVPALTQAFAQLEQVE
ncbi:hypothetical protein [Agarivorans sp.]|uniref:hypothetical protein n=1 Tax=Agarivorans sp. TaxID=1872412 RepID=UPI003D035DF6